MTKLDEVVAAPGEIGVALIGVREGSEIDLDLRFESVHEGILVSGTATVEIDGECGRCLEAIAYDFDADIQELYYYEGLHEFTEEEDLDQYQVVDDRIDLEPVLRNAVVTALPFQPVCREDCAGLCSECGKSLNEDPEHHHEVLDPRWAALAGLTDIVAEDATQSTHSVEREEK